MNTNTHAVRRRLVACAAAALVLPGLAACGTEIDPPAQDLSRGKIEKTLGTVPVPARTSGNRLDFGDEYGKATAKKRSEERTGTGSLNRLDFRDNGL